MPWPNTQNLLLLGFLSPQLILQLLKINVFPQNLLMELDIVKKLPSICVRVGACLISKVALGLAILSFRLLAQLGSQLICQNRAEKQTQLLKQIRL